MIINKKTKLATSFLEASPDGALVVDEDGIVLWCNPAAQHLLREKGSALAGTLLGIPVRAGLATEALVGRDDEARVVHLTVALMSWRGMSALAVAVRPVVTRPEGASTVGQATDGQLTAQDLLQVMHHGIWCLDSDHRTVFVNEAVTGMLGYPEEAILGRRPTDFMDEAGRAAAAERLERRRRGVEETLELNLVHRSGRPVPVLVATTPRFDAEGRYAGVIAGVIDITDQRARDAELDEARERLDRAQRLEALERFVGGITHDFNNTLMVIQGSVHLLLEQIGDPTLLEDVEAIRGAAGDAQALIGNLLAFARQQPAEPGPVNVRDQLRQCAELLRTLVPEGVTLRFVEPEDDPIVEADPSAIGRVIMNLFVNAVDAVGDRGNIEIRATTVPAAAVPDLDPDAPRAPRYLLLSIQDDGTGMSDATRRRIFEPFFTTKDPGKGTGLGLSTVHGIVTRHHGRITVSSEPGKGTRFAVHWPCREG